MIPQRPEGPREAAALDDPGAVRGPRIARLLLASTAVVALATAALTVHLVGSAVEDRVQLEIARTARLVGDAGFPLGDESLRRVAGLVDADVVAIDAGGVAAASLPEGPRRDFEAAWRAGALPRPAREARVVEARIGATRYTLGVAPTPRGGVYLVYEAGLVSREARRAWLPVSLVVIGATALAVLLGIAGERSVLRARTGALLKLLVSVAHEVRNPLGAIRAIARAQARAIDRTGAADAAQLELIAAETDRLALLIEGLRSVGRPVATVRRPVDPDATVDDVLKLLSHQLAHRQVTVARERPGAAVVVEADAMQVRQVALNLLQNAADAMPRGGAVRVRSGAAGGRWRLEVEDEGPGVAEPLRARLFEPFVTTKESGLGVGLYLSRRLARAHGGELSLAPAPAPGERPRGARFVLELPLAPPGVAAAEPTPAHGLAKPHDVRA